MLWRSLLVLWCRLRREAWPSLALTSHDASEKVAWAMANRRWWCLIWTNVLWWSTASRHGWTAAGFKFSVQASDLFVVPRRCQYTMICLDAIRQLTSVLGPCESAPFGRPFRGPFASPVTVDRLREEWSAPFSRQDQTRARATLIKLTRVFILSACSSLSLKLGANLIEELIQARVPRRRAHSPMRIIHSRHYDYRRKGFTPVLLGSWRLDIELLSCVLNDVEMTALGLFR